MSAKMTVAVRNRQNVSTVESFPGVMAATTGKEPAMISENTTIKRWATRLAFAR
jgi:hypothetical protein